MTLATWQSQTKKSTCSSIIFHLIIFAFYKSRPTALPVAPIVSHAFNWPDFLFYFSKNETITSADGKCSYANLSLGFKSYEHGVQSCWMWNSVSVQWKEMNSFLLNDSKYTRVQMLKIIMWICWNAQFARTFYLWQDCINAVQTKCHWHWCKSDWKNPISNVAA